MPGIYLHIPFCKKACHYCNFHFSTSQKLRQPLVDAMLKELDWQKNYLQNVPLTSIYFGGGTPSILPPADLTRIFEKIEQLHQITPDAEITLEANPDDLTPDFLHFLKNETPVNRLSIGVQSFSDDDLKWMNRAHSAEQSKNCIENAHSAGFEQLTIDLIYGSPSTTDEIWKDNLQQLFSFKLPHFSAYCLTVEEKTALGKWVKTGKHTPPDEATAARQFQILLQMAADAGFEHYEISNFAQPGCRARHNSSYWLGEDYLGIGPSAHSFNQISRQWNVANNSLYINSLEKGILPFEIEFLTLTDRYNEYVLTSLRTSWGCDLSKIRAMDEKFAHYFEQSVVPWLEAGAVIRINGDHFILSDAGKWQADGIAADLFWEEKK